MGKTIMAQNPFITKTKTYKIINDVEQLNYLFKYSKKKKNLRIVKPKSLDFYVLIL